MTEPLLRDPQALRRSVTDRLTALVRTDPRVNLSDLLRQFAYDRLLTRVFSGPVADGWILKGATAMLARLGPDGRHTRDIDLYRRAGGAAEAEEALRAAAGRDIGDLFRFEVTSGRPTAGATQARRVRVTAYLGATQFASFPVDLVTDIDMTSTPETLGPLVPIPIPGIVTTPYRVYPLTDHIADKVHALHELHERIAGPAQPSTRYRDLVDLAVFARTTRPGAEALIRAVRSQGRRRRLALPSRLTVPSTPDWPPGYAREVRNAPGAADRTLEAAVGTVRHFLDPVLAGSAVGVWDPASLSWTGGSGTPLGTGRRPNPEDEATALAVEAQHETRRPRAL